MIATLLPALAASPAPLSGGRSAEDISVIFGRAVGSTYDVFSAADNQEHGDFTQRVPGGATGGRTAAVRSTG